VSARFAIFDNYLAFAQWLAPLNASLGIPNPYKASYTQAHTHPNAPADERIACSIGDDVPWTGLTVVDAAGAQDLGWFITAEELADARSQKVSELHRSFHEHQEEYVDGPGFTMLESCKRNYPDPANDCPEAMKVCEWINTLWGYYYTLKATVYAATNLPAVNAVEADFEGVVGPFPTDFGLVVAEYQGIP
jgi:hypothetical protein